MSIRALSCRALLAVFASLSLACGAIDAKAADDGPLIFAAASMTDALKLAAERYEATGRIAPRFSFASSSILAKQIAQGAPADLFISASEEWMDWLAEKSAIVPESRRDIAANSLVIVGPSGTTEADNVGRALADGRFAIGDPGHVPVGIYAKQALTAEGLWTKVKDRAVLGENVRVALELVARGEVARAIVYRSDLLAAPDLAAVYFFSADRHDPITYPAALTATAEDKNAAKGFLDYLLSEEGQAALKDTGFEPVSAGDHLGG